MTPKRTKRPAARRRAATADVVGHLSPQKVLSKWQKHYKHLMELRDHVLSRQDDLVKDANEEPPAFSLHMADAGTDSYDRDFALSRICPEQDALYEIEQALNRIRNGTCGICELTGEPIEPERLMAIPWARFSADAEKQLEKDGAVRRARLGPREALARVAIKPAEAQEAAGEET
jgi:RNA polymerase-binding transcription factor DksA